MCGNDLESSPLSVVVAGRRGLGLLAARSPCSRAGSVVCLKWGGREIQWPELSLQASP